MSEDYLDEAGDVHLAAQVASCRWGLHINASRNARIRQVEWQELQLALEVGFGIKLTEFGFRSDCQSSQSLTLFCRCSLVAAALQGSHEHSAHCKQKRLGLAAAQKPGAGARGSASHVAGS